MANIFELNINLNAVENSETKKALSETSNAKTKTANTGDDKDDKLAGLKMGLKMAAAVHVTQKLNSNVAMPLLNMGTTTIGTIYGDTARLNQIQNLNNSVSTGMGLISSGFSGFAAGKAVTGGAGGGSAGAIIAITLDVVGKAIDMVTSAMEYNNRQIDHVYNSNYAQERLGLLAINKGR